MFVGFLVATSSAAGAAHFCKFLGQSAIAAETPWNSCRNKNLGTLELHLSRKNATADCHGKSHGISHSNFHA